MEQLDRKSINLYSFLIAYIMNILFVDLTDLLNSQYYTNMYEQLFDNNSIKYDYKTSINSNIDKFKISMLNMIVTHTNCKLVISTDTDHSLEEIKDIFNNYEFKGNILDVTPKNSKLKNRGDEIQFWMSFNNSIKKYAILNSNKEIFGDFINVLDDEMFFKINPKQGITLLHANKIINYFNKK